MSSKLYNITLNKVDGSVDVTSNYSHNVIGKWNNSNGMYNGNKDNDANIEGGRELFSGLFFFVQRGGL